MSFGISLSSPPPIGNVTPNTLAGTTQTLTSITEQQRIRYDTTHYLATTIDINGVVMWNNPTDIDYRWQFGGNTYLRFGSNALTMTLPFGSFWVDSAGQYAAGRSRFSVGGAPDSGPGISDGGAISTLGLCIGGTDYVLVTASLFKLTSGVALQLGNAAVTGLVAGALAALTNATVTLKDSSGQTYRIPCII